jgi:hypothetical protein
MTLTRNVPLKPGAWLTRTPFPLRPAGLPGTPWPRTVPGIITTQPCITGSRGGISPAAESGVSARKPIRPVSKKRAAENRERRAMADRLWPDRREGTVMCGCGRDECHRLADDLHEPLTRARGGSIIDEANAIPLARVCHDEITLGPEWAYTSGLLKHSWNADGDDAT